MRYVSGQLLALLQKAKNEKLVDIEVLRAAGEQSRRDREGLQALKERAVTEALHPFHAVYTAALRLVTQFMESLTTLGRLEVYAETVDRSFGPDILPKVPSPYPSSIRALFSTSVSDLTMRRWGPVSWIWGRFSA